MKRVYNYNTGKLYEAEGTFNITMIERTPNGGERCLDVDQKYVSREEALDSIDGLIDDILMQEGYDMEDCDYIQTDDGAILGIPGNKEFEFVVSGVVTEGRSRRNRGFIGESGKTVASRFGRLHSLYEADEDEEETDKDDNEDNDNNNDGGKDDADNGDDADTKDNDDNDDKKDNDDDEEQELKAVIITVKKGDEDKCKDELIDAGIGEDSIEILSDDDEDAENVEIRIDADSVMELKDYLEKKGIDLEEEIGAELVSDDDEDSDDEDSDDNGDEKSDDDEEGGDNFDFNDLGDLFGAGDEGGDNDDK